LEFKPDAPRDVTGYGKPLRDIVLPNEGVRQVANRQGEHAQNGLTQYVTRTGAKRGRAHTWGMSVGSAVARAPRTAFVPPADRVGCHEPVVSRRARPVDPGA